MAATGLPWGPQPDTVLLGPSYRQVQLQVIRQRASFNVRDLGDLQHKTGYLLANTYAATTLQQAKTQWPDLNWFEVSGKDVEELLEQLALGQADYVITSSQDFELAKHIYPNLEVAYTLPQALPLQWRFAPGQTKLQQQAVAYFQKITANGELKQWLDRYYGHTHRLAPLDAEEFLKKRPTVLPGLKKGFFRAEENTGMDWRLLAALSYQESHWDSYAISPNGAMGLMMLTSNTADLLGVSDRTDATQAIRGGARYLQTLKDMLPSDVGEPDRTWIALAAYNVGYGHVLDARTLAKQRGQDPNLWMNLKTTLPMLARPEHHRYLKYGYARGGEPVIFVENLRLYYDILSRFESPHIPGFPAFQTNVAIDNPSEKRMDLNGRMQSDGRVSTRIAEPSGDANDKLVRLNNTMAQD